MQINHLPVLSCDEALARITKSAGSVANTAAELLNPDFYDPEQANIRWHSGDLHLPSFLPTKDDMHDYDCLIVEGNLIVDGCMEVSPQIDEGGIIVLGRLQADTLICWSGLVVRGDASVQHAYFSSGNDCSFVVGGNLTAISLLETGEFIHVHGDLDARCLALLHNFVQVDGEERCGCRIDGSQCEEPMKRMFDPSLLKAFEGEDADGQRIVGWYPDDDAYLERLQEGGSPLRSGD
ncbi:hypothetical protein M6G53_20515 [Serratia nevei]|uniref:hypothetical protein n=1 Tax=Serratia nevei TaxID=2703794 RepID=UPI00209FC0AB|nr:hypothetical protein [Serratia nevei]MCP1107757.1 hypothetical protein [Serratia nevei]